VGVAFPVVVVVVVVVAAAAAAAVEAWCIVEVTAAPPDELPIPTLIVLSLFSPPLVERVLV